MKKATSFTENNLVRGLRESLQYEFKNHVKNGIYSYTQKKLAYSSNRIEGSTLTADQTSLLLIRALYTVTRFFVRKILRKRMDIF